MEIKVQETSGYFKGVLRLSTLVQEDKDRVVETVLRLQETGTEMCVPQAALFA